jgi:tetratricopeptide (TPR) repeat protein
VYESRVLIPYELKAWDSLNHSIMTKKNAYALILFFFPVLVFLSLLYAGFVWDDYRNFVGNPRISVISISNFLWFFKSLEYDNYFPFTWISIALDYALWEKNPSGFHLTNIVLHSVNAVILFFLILEVLGKFILSKVENITASFFAAMLFAVHPLRTETVAWISTRGDLLCAIFLQISFIFYIGYSKNESKKKYILSLIFCLASFFCRPWAFLFPIVLLLYDLAFREKPDISIKKKILEKIPFLALSAIFAIPALMSRGGGMRGISEHGLFARLIQIFYNFYFYAEKTLVPSGLSPLYPFASFTASSPKFIVPAVLAMLFSVYLIIKRKEMKGLCFAWFSYIAIILPVSGITQGGEQLSADRYSYISTIPFYVLIAWTFAKFAELGGRRFANFAGKSWLAIPIILTLFFSYLSRIRSDAWLNDETLWTRVIKSGNACETAYYNRGLYFSVLAGEKKGAERDESYLKALSDFEAALKYSPRKTGILLNRGKVFLGAGSLKKAEEDFSAILEENPVHLGALSNRAAVFEKMNEPQKALSDLSKIIETAPRDVEARMRRALLLISLRRLQEAETELNRVIELAPDSASAYLNRGGLFLLAGKPEKAVSDFKKALDLSPGMIQASQNLKMAEELIDRKKSP